MAGRGGQVRIYITADSAGVQKGTAQAETALSRLNAAGSKSLGGLRHAGMGAGASMVALGGHTKHAGERMTTFGHSASKLTLPLLATGGASAKMALDFNDAMGKVARLVGVGRAQMAYRNGRPEHPRTRRGRARRAWPTVCTSLLRGSRGHLALDALKMSAKASAADLGATKDIANATTFQR